MSDSSTSTSTPHPAKSSLPMLYYGLVVVGTAAIVLVLYNFIVIKWCSDNRHRRRMAGSYEEMMNSSRSFQSSLSSFKFKKVAGAGAEEGNGNECAVCLSAFEDGEEVKKLPRCTHTFHASCIDMWLYSHSDCPLCRAPVAVAVAGRSRHEATAEQEENSGHVLLEV
ncbi:RING-H2 finger protein ATL39 [Cucumis sativus]|uniref:RING-type E3 ubiquitin transferase n=1 Tax=Cucumis sativus TaxID=3659 RepID=A0A0A0LWX2_CUCSA|nr:RING-H2 finger protein ATL39 [Cucumis sativus]KGN66278.1 hypothetical protein Csa_007702 [Cucumis sativus]